MTGSNVSKATLILYTDYVLTPGTMDGISEWGKVYECRATHTAGVRSGRHRIRRSASPGRISEK